MIQALRHHGKKPQQVVCAWNKYLRDKAKASSSSITHPTPEEPLVFHLHGIKDDPESIVLTEDDYLEFLISISKDINLIPSQIRKALSSHTLLFIGYSLRDWNFRVLFRGLVKETERVNQRASFSVQWSSNDTPVAEAIQAYDVKYFQEMNVVLCLGSARDFAAELQKRWRAYQ